MDILRIDTRYMRLEKALRRLKNHGKEVRKECLDRKYYKKPNQQRNEIKSRFRRKKAKRISEEANTRARWKAHDRKLRNVRIYQS